MISIIRPTKKIHGVHIQSACKCGCKGLLCCVCSAVRDSHGVGTPAPALPASPLTPLFLPPAIKPSEQNTRCCFTACGVARVAHMFSASGDGGCPCLTHTSLLDGSPPCLSSDTHLLTHTEQRGALRYPKQTSSDSPPHLAPPAPHNLTPSTTKQPDVMMPVNAAHSPFFKPCLHPSHHTMPTLTLSLALVPFP